MAQVLCCLHSFRELHGDTGEHAVERLSAILRLLFARQELSAAVSSSSKLGSESTKVTNCKFNKTGNCVGFESDSGFHPFGNAFFLYKTKRHRQFGTPEQAVLATCLFRLLGELEESTKDQADSPDSSENFKSQDDAV